MPDNSPLHRVFRRLDVPDDARSSLLWDTLAGMLAGAYMGMVFPFVTRVARGELGADGFWLAVLSAAPFVGNLLAPFWATRMDSRNTLTFLLASWIPARALFLLLPLFPSAAGFALLVGAVQMIGAFASPAYAAVMRDIYPGSHRGRLMGIVRVGVQALSFIAAQWVGRWMDAGISHKLLFPIAGVLGIGSALAFSKVRRLANSPNPLVSGTSVPFSKALTDSIGILRENPPYRWFAASVMTYGFGNLMAMPLYGLFQVDILKLTNSEIALISNVAALSSIPASFLWGKILDRRGPAFTVAISIVWVSGIGVVYCFASSLGWLLASAVCSGVGFAGIEISYLQSTLQFAERDGRPTRYQALHSLLLGIRGIVAPILSLALLPSIGYRPLFVATLLLMWLGAWLQSRVDPSRRHHGY